MDKQLVVSKLAELQQSYTPNEGVLNQLSHINLIAVVGPTGAGKSTLVKRSGLPFVIGDTTRNPRDGEIQGRDYNFRADLANIVSEIEAGEFVQFVVQRGSEVYGTKATSYPPSGACAMSLVASSLPRFRELGFASITPVYVVPPNHTEWMKRISNHRDKDLESRLVEAKESLRVALADSSYVFVVNDELESAVALLKAIVRGSIDQTASAKARVSANILYDHIQRVIR